jgi:outer membrane lipoprotein-sorting protein
MRTLFVPLGIAFCCVAFCQEKPEAGELLRKVRSNYAKANRFHFVWITTKEKPQADPIFSRDFYEYDVALERPNRARFGEVESKAGIAMSSLAVVDGTDVFVYDNVANKYFEAKAVPPDTALDDLTDQNQSAFYLQGAQGVIDGMKEKANWSEHTAVIGDQRLRLAKGTIDCWVIEIKGKPTADDVTTLWIEKRHYVIRREVVKTGTETSITTYKVVMVDKPLSRDLFQFSPPAGARKVARVADLDSK